MKKMTYEEMFYALSIGTLLVGGILWLSSIDNKASASVAGLQSIQNKVDQDQRAFEEIRLHLAHIDDALNR